MFSNLKSNLADADDDGGDYVVVAIYLQSFFVLCFELLVVVFCCLIPLSWILS